MRRRQEANALSRPLHKWHLAILLIPLGLLLGAKILGATAPQAVSWLYAQSSGTRSDIFTAFKIFAAVLCLTWLFRQLTRFGNFLSFCCLLGNLHLAGKLPNDLSNLMPKA
jgi:hypothetical protein